MATKKYIIHIETFDGMLKVWTDLPITDIESIEGIVSVSDNNLKEQGHLWVNYDPRYELDTIIEELRLMARKYDEEN